MNIEFALLGVRLLLIVLLYVFIAAVAWVLWHETRSQGLAVRHPQRFQAQLVELHNQRVYWAMPVTGIGRAVHNTVQLTAETVSLEHALLTQRGEQWLLQDLNSSNGTQLNGIAVTDNVVVRPGDVIGIGEVLLRFDVLPAA